MLVRIAAAVLVIASIASARVSSGQAEPLSVDAAAIAGISAGRAAQ
jgi:hypothetical protein